MPRRVVCYIKGNDDEVEQGEGWRREGGRNEGGREESRVAAGGYREQREEGGERGASGARCHAALRGSKRGRGTDDGRLRRTTNGRSVVGSVVGTDGRSVGRLVGWLVGWFSPATLATV